MRPKNLSRIIVCVKHVLGNLKPRLATHGDVLVQPMFDSELSEALRMAYTLIQQHQERMNRRIQLSKMIEVLREHLARFEEGSDDR